jgi:hypothetical protein
MRSLVTVALTALCTTLLVHMISRWRFMLAGGAFWCQLRLTTEQPPRAWPRLRSRWSRRLLARWDDEVLVVRRGTWAANAILPASVDADGVRSIPAWDPKRCGRRPLSLQLHVRDGAGLEIAARARSRVNLVGPYLTAAMHDLPRAPVPRRDPDE